MLRQSCLMPGQIQIQLKPREKPVDLDEKDRRSLMNEMQVRYLEQIGAAPTRANLAMVRRNVPVWPVKFTLIKVEEL